MSLLSIQLKFDSNTLIMTLDALLPLALAASDAARSEILQVYNSGDFQAETKGDNSPLTLADKKAHDAIARILAPAGLPILSEEGRSIPFEERKQWEYFWMVDPLDGTKEFIKRNGEFTVNIALIHKGKPVLGVVAVPVSGETFYATQGGGAWLKKNGMISRLPIKQKPDMDSPGLRVVASRSHMNDETQDFIDRLREPVLVSKGSSLKFMLLAEGKADIYPRFAPTIEWDTAAAHAVILEVGLSVRHTEHAGELQYNKPDLLNPHFIVS